MWQLFLEHPFIYSFLFICIICILFFELWEDAPTPGSLETSPEPYSEKKIIKLAGHCYDGTGWNTCHFWAGHGHSMRGNNKNPEGKSRCLLFGGKNGVEKDASCALKACDKIYGTSYEGRP